MPLQRPMLASIYNLVSTWHVNEGGVNYVAHLITRSDPFAFRLGEPLLGEKPGSSPPNHPDQVFWGRNNQTSIKKALAQAGQLRAVERIEIDCSLLPCDTNRNFSCLYRVPRLILAWGFTNVPLRIFSHRNEGLGGLNASAGRVIECNTEDGQLALRNAYGANRDWSWVP